MILSIIIIIAYLFAPIWLFSFIGLTFTNFLMSSHLINDLFINLMSWYHDSVCLVIPFYLLACLLKSWTILTTHFSYYSAKYSLVSWSSFIFASKTSIYIHFGIWFKIHNIFDFKHRTIHLKMMKCYFLMTFAYLLIINLNLLNLTIYCYKICDHFIYFQF